MLTLQQIIDETATLVPNEVPVGDQIVWLNAINNDFFNVVKIPRIARFTTVQGQSNYVMSNEVQDRNIDLVHVGVLKYRSLDEDDVNPLQNAFSFDDLTHTLTLSPAPYLGGLAGVLRYRRIATTIFTSSNLSAVPDAPDAFQWTYIPALAAYLANTQNDSVKAANYENQVKTAWNMAAQNYVNGVVE